MKNGECNKKEVDEFMIIHDKDECLGYEKDMRVSKNTTDIAIMVSAVESISFYILLH